MSALRNAVFALALAFSGAEAAAMPAAGLSTFASFEDRLTSGEPLQLAQQQQAAADYFDFDAIVTVGALLLAGGAFAGFGAFAARRARQAEAAEPVWRERVLRAVQADLAAFERQRRAA